MMMMTTTPQMNLLFPLGMYLVSEAATARGVTLLLEDDDVYLNARHEHGADVGGAIEVPALPHEHEGGHKHHKHKLSRGPGRGGDKAAAAPQPALWDVVF